MRIEDYRSLTRMEQFLIDRAVNARQCARADYSHFKVGAAVIRDISSSPFYEITAGCNVENAIYEVTHAEQAAIASLALQTPVGEPMRIGAVAVALLAEKEDQHAVPCGFCRQLIREFGNDDTAIYGVKLNAKGLVWQVEIYALGELLPFSFGPNNLNR